MAIQDTIIDEAGALVDVKPFTNGGAAAVNTGAAAIELAAAVASKRHFIAWWQVTNITAGEYPVAVLQDDTGTPIKHAHMAPNAGIATSKPTKRYNFDPPIEIASGKAVDYALQSATGDCHSSVGGWIEI